MAGPRRDREKEKRLRSLRDRLEKVGRNDALADVILEELETLEPDNARWPHRRGDLFRKRERTADAVHCYTRAVSLYALAGFLPRAIAMAKVVLEVDPRRIDVLEQVDPSTARELHRRLRPEGARSDGDEAQALDERAAELEPDSSAQPNEVRFSAPSPQRRPRPPTGDIEVTVIELDARPEPPAIPMAGLGVREAERQACLPLLPLLAEAPPEALSRLAHESELIRVADAGLVVRRGDPADALFGIVEGAVRVNVPGAEAGDRPRLTEGDIFGEACLLGNEPRRADVIAEGALTALRIPKQTLTELVQAHRALGDVLFEMLARRLLGNLLSTSPLFAVLSAPERRAVAAEFELRRARTGTELVAAGRQSDAIYITLTGQVEIASPGTPPQIEGPGLMFGHASMLEGSPSTLDVRTRDTLLVLRLPRQAFSRVAMQYPVMLMRLSELTPVARIGH